MSDAQDRETRRNVGTMMALMSLLLVGVGFLFLVVMVLPRAIFFVFVILAFASFVALHYITWGWWMLRMRPKEPEEDEGP